MEPLMNGHRGGTVGGGGAATVVSAGGKAAKAGDAAIADVFPAPPNPSISKANVRECDPKEAIVNENVSLVISRQLLTDTGNTLVKMEDSVAKAVSHFTLEIVQPRVISFEDQVVAIRQHLADIYEREQNWSEAAKVSQIIS